MAAAVVSFAGVDLLSSGTKIRRGIFPLRSEANVGAVEMTSSFFSLPQLVADARRFATIAHAGQFRKYNGQPYHVHPRRVGQRLLDLGFVPHVAAAGEAHDILEDCPQITYEQLKRVIGLDAAEMVRALTNPSKKFPSMLQAEKKTLDREHIVRQVYSVRCVKLVDRIDNVNDMALAPIADQKRYAEESRLLLDALRGTHPDLERELHYALCTVEARVGEGVSDAGAQTKFGAKLSGNSQETPP